MKGGKRPLGYTIIEVMVVLAVSGVMFLIAATFISGKQATTAFTAGSNELGSRLQGVIEDITDGHYSDIPIPCSANAGGGLSFLGSTLGQGTNSNCVFLGKLVHFYASGTASPENYEVLSLADARLNPTTHLPVAGVLPNSYVAAIDSLTTTQAIPQSLEIKDITVVDAAGVNQPSTNADLAHGSFSIGFILNLGTTDAATGTTYQTGAQTVGLIYANSTNGSAAHLAGTVTDNSVLPAQSATICVTDGTRYAQIQIGTNDAATGGTGAGNQLNVNVQQKGQTAC